jgi:flagellar assembly factor FliW
LDPGEVGLAQGLLFDAFGAWTKRRRGGQEWMDAMRIATSRFGTLDLDDGDAIAFPTGLIGFSEETSFVILRPKTTSAVAWLQSTKTGWLALPVVSLDALDFDVDDEVLVRAAKFAGIAGDQESVAAMVVLNAPAGGQATVNVLAPIIVNAETRRGAQIMVEGMNGSTRQPFVLRPVVSSDGDPAQSKVTADARPADDAP